MTMTTTPSSRIWEEPDGGRNGQHNGPNGQAALPPISTVFRDSLQSGTSRINSSPSYRPDSGQYPSGPQSTRSSAYSSGFNGIYSSPGIGSPHRASNSSQFATTSHPSEHLPTINQRGEPPQYRGSQDYPGLESRRSSIGSEVGGLRNLALNGAPSPYAASANQSTTSIQASLQRERGITPGTNGVRNSRASGNGSMHHQPMSPLSQPPERQPGESQHAYNQRSAPSIGANPMREVYNADRPTAGQPYAFPDPDMNSSGESHTAPRHPSGAGPYHQESERTSINSSLHTTDSRVPGAATENGAATHHHSLQQRQVNQLTGESDSPDGASPYSRTPALRASHKLAERKRRTEMKYLFDALRNQIPPSHGSKSSKWEILTKASEYIKSLEAKCSASQQAQSQLSVTTNDLGQAIRECENLRAENARLYREMDFMRDNRHPPHMAQPPMPTHYAAPPAPMSVESRSLPPIGNAIHASSMQGVQYTDGSR